MCQSSRRGLTPPGVRLERTLVRGTLGLEIWFADSRIPNKCVLNHGTWPSKFSLPVFLNQIGVL